MPKKPLENLTESMFYVLMAFGRGSMCGCEVAEFIEQRTKGRILMGPATLYTILSKFEQEGYIEEVSVEGRKRTYQITDRGMVAYGEEVKRLQKCVADAAAEEALVHRFVEAAGGSTQPMDRSQDHSSESVGTAFGERGLQVCPC